MCQPRMICPCQVSLKRGRFDPGKNESINTNDKTCDKYIYIYILILIYTYLSDKHSSHTEAHIHIIYYIYTYIDTQSPLSANFSHLAWSNPGASKSGCWAPNELGSAQHNRDCCWCLWLYWYVMLITVFFRLWLYKTITLLDCFGLL